MDIKYNLIGCSKVAQDKQRFSLFYEKDFDEICIGNFSNCGSQKEINKFIQKFAYEIDIPVYVTDQFGHENCNSPIVYNATAILSNNKMTIKLD